MLELFDDASGFVFDCDGTLLDSMRAWDEVERWQIESIGRDLTMPELEVIRSLPMNEAGVLLHEKYGLGDSPEWVIREVDARLQDFYATQVEPLPGVRAFVELMVERGVPCSVVSSSPDRYLFAGFDRCGMTDLFAAIISTDAAGMSKQDPGIYHLACERMGSEVATTWGADDSLYAVKAMRAAGLRTIGAYDGDSTGSFEELSRHADVAIRSFEELLA
ncbi:MAG: HAD family hydrolase [Coriobacteriales bacterium]|jgi:HAD superfamily hydrolase (TIGR01509 family)